MADDMFRPPINRAMRSLDRAFFLKKIPTSAARVYNNQQISKCRSELMKTRDSLFLDRFDNIRLDPAADAPKGRKCIVLRPEIKPDDADTWSETVRSLVNDGQIGVIPYEVQLDYDYWGYHDIMSSILPEDEQDEIPGSFAAVGHVAHLNLRSAYLPYKHLIAQVILDKNPVIRTVINKIDNVGDENEYRTFSYEVLAGPDDLNVEVKHEHCSFRFDYSKVYWNLRLNTEHARMVEKFHAGEAVCDIMAGVGPFAVPAGKKGVFVWANDLNPDSFASLADAVKRNKVSDFVQAFCEDGHAFIRNATHRLLDDRREVRRHQKPTSDKSGKAKIIKTVSQPRVFSHYVMNLPATAINFLPSFIGLYKAEQETVFAPHTSQQLPMIHVYCFSTKSDDNVAEGIKICEEISKQLDYPITPDAPELTITDVRDVAPNKRMFCASFRLPADVAFRQS